MCEHSESVAQLYASKAQIHIWFAWDLVTPPYNSLYTTELGRELHFTIPSQQQFSHNKLNSPQMQLNCKLKSDPTN